jgi:hypothetical protein
MQLLGRLQFSRKVVNPKIQKEGRGCDLSPFR